MTHYTDQEFLEVQRRMNITQESISQSELRRLDIQDPESTLSKDARKWAIAQGYPALILRQSKKVRGLIPPGWTDGVIAMPEGKTLWLEFKVPGKGRMGDDQKLMAQQLLTLGHRWFEVKTWKQFMEIVNEQT